MWIGFYPRECLLCRITSLDIENSMIRRRSEGGGCFHGVRLRIVALVLSNWSVHLAFLGFSLRSFWRRLLRRNLFRLRIFWLCRLCCFWTGVERVWITNGNHFCWLFGTIIDPRFRIWLQPRRRGGSWSSRVGIQGASGLYIFYSKFHFFYLNWADKTVRTEGFEVDFVMLMKWRAICGGEKKRGF